jgi:hypothetical protein
MAFDKFIKDWLKANEDKWPEMPINNIIRVKEENTAEGEEPQPKKASFGSKYDFQHYLHVMGTKKNTPEHRRKLAEKQVKKLNELTTEENGFKYLTFYKVGDDLTADPPVKPDQVFFDDDIVRMMITDYGMTVSAMAENDFCIDKYFTDHNRGKSVLLDYHRRNASDAVDGP